MKSILKEVKPDIVLVHGDTATTFATTWEAYYEQIPVGHVEAGLHTGNLYSPWPEEADRKLTGALAELHFAPTALSQQNLLDEGVAPAKVTVTGNTVIDALLSVVEKLENDSTFQAEFAEKFRFLNPESQLILVTGHRRESFASGFERICQALCETALKHPQSPFVTSGLCISTPAVTTRGFGEEECTQLAGWICDILDVLAKGENISAIEAKVLDKVAEICTRLPVYK
ncbi:UDP-N-acetylglucosamine 2-epimerase [Halomonas sp. QHL1]|uniref:UDP-N-acetylglucosamine 2-epimerase n=1 Tax=Halomonas sp. QHL1 TaxID=1123773 RepID=UPI000A9D66CB|nr:UDP-N-acetylglucosamine 2-epimerase [Halomonas sp. QHL1]